MKKTFKKFILMLLLMFSAIGLFACQQEIIATLDIDYKEEVIVGEEFEITVTSSVEGDQITFENLNPEILELEENKVKAIDEGIGEIKIISQYKTMEIISIFVNEVPAPSKINFNIIGENFVIEEEYQLTIEILPSNASKDIYFLYTDSQLTINEETMSVIFHKAGNHKIYCFSRKDRGIYGLLDVNVDFNPNIEMYELLYVGNSLTKYHHDIPAMVVAMMEEKGIKVNCTLDGPEAQWIIDHKDTFNRLIDDTKYTHVILQERSHGTVSDYNKFESAVLEFKEKIDENGAKLVLYQTWAYNTDNWEGMTKYEMYEGIRDAYLNVAELSNAILIPAGDAFMEFETTYGLDPTLYFDANHPSEYGAFLSACVHYATLTGRKASELQYVYGEISEAIALKIKEIADKVVFGE